MQNNFNFEIKRKIFHLCGIILPLFYYFVSKTFMVTFLFFVTALIIYIDTTRHYNPLIKNFINKFCAKFTREHEISGNYRLSGVSYMFLGFLISAALFSKGLAINCFLVLVICDAAAAIIGKTIGYNKLNYGKSIEGAVAFCLTSVFVGLLSYQFVGYSTNFFIICLSSIAATFIELNSKSFNLDDNLTIPVGFGITSSLLSFVLL